MTHGFHESSEMMVMKESSAFSSKSVHMESSIQEASFSSSSLAEMKFETMSQSSMSSMTSESVYAMSSSSIKSMSSHSHAEGSAMRAVMHSGQGEKTSHFHLSGEACHLPLFLQCCNLIFFPLNNSGSAPRIEALPEEISIETGKVLTVACAFSGEPVPHIEWSRSGKKLPGEDSSGRFHVDTTEDLTTLIITAVKESDAGAYTLKLSNEHGSDTATVTISIRSV